MFAQGARLLLGEQPGELCSPQDRIVRRGPQLRLALVLGETAWALLRVGRHQRPLLWQWLLREPARTRLNFGLPLQRYVANPRRGEGTGGLSQPLKHQKDCGLR